MMATTIATEKARHFFVAPFTYTAGRADCDLTPGRLPDNLLKSLSLPAEIRKPTPQIAGICCHLPAFW